MLGHKSLVDLILSNRFGCCFQLPILQFVRVTLKKHSVHYLLFQNIIPNQMWLLVTHFFIYLSVYRTMD